MESEVNGALPPYQPYPEWRQLKANIQPLLDAKKTEFSYEELKAIAGIDIQTNAGRAQFYRFRKHAQREWNVWFEVVPGKGYVCLAASEHSKAAVSRVRAAGRKMDIARSIQRHVRLDELTPQQLYLHAQTAALIDDLGKSFKHTGKKLTQLAAQYKIGLSEEEAKQLLAETPAKTKPSKPSSFRIDPDATQ